MTPQVGRILLEFDGKPHIAVGFVAGEQQVRGAHHLTPVGLLSWGYQVEFIILILRRRVWSWWARGRTNEVQTIPYLRVEYVSPLISKPVELEKERDEVWVTDKWGMIVSMETEIDSLIFACMYVHMKPQGLSEAETCPFVHTFFTQNVNIPALWFRRDVREGICVVLLANVMKMSICVDHVLPTIVKPEIA